MGRAELHDALESAESKGKGERASPRAQFYAPPRKTFGMGTEPNEGIHKKLRIRKETLDPRPSTLGVNSLRFDLSYADRRDALSYAVL
jgi:hypothetical protein